MDEIRELTVELLREFDGMEPEMIEGLREEWLKQLKASDAERYQKVEGFVNAVCDVAINRARRKEKVA